MIQKVLVPPERGQRYYSLHYRFFIEAMRAAGIKVETGAVLHDYDVSFEARIDGRPVTIDFSDHFHAETLGLDMPIFKFHYSRARHGEIENVFPLSPISFHEWYSVPEIEYQPAKSRRILNAQRPGGAATERRAAVQAKLRKAFGDDLDTEITDQAGFWARAGECAVAVCVPGARLDILDRGQLQLMALGVCTISTRLDITLPFGNEIEAGWEYVECRPDFSDLIEKVEWCRSNPVACERTGQNAAETFDRACRPARLAHWIEQCLEVTR